MNLIIFMRKEIPKKVIFIEEKHKTNRYLHIQKKLFDEKQNSKKKSSSRGGGLLNVYVVFRGGLPNVYVYLQGGRGGQKWPKSCLRSKSMTP